MTGAPAQELCPCGRPLHYRDARVARTVHDLVERFGPTVVVIAGPQAWHVPRHYVALHGIQAMRMAELARLHNWRPA